MASIPISARQATRVAVVFAALILGFGILSSITSWPDAQSWWLVLVVSLIIAALPLVGPVSTFLHESGAVIDIKGVKLAFNAAAVRGVSMERVNLEDNPGIPVNDSSAASIAEAAEAARSAPFVVLDLCTGRSWYPTRLFALAAAAEELHGAQAIVILAQRGGVPKRFVGWIEPKHAVAAFCQSDQRYRLALNHARAILQHLRLSGGYVYRFPTEFPDGSDFRRAYLETGDLALVPALISRLQQTPVDPDPSGASMAQQDPLENVNRPACLSWEEAERLFDPWLIREHIQETQPEAEKWAKLARSGGDFLAVTDDIGRYRGMIDTADAIRSALLFLPSAKS
jgi:hypothetical protein